MSYSSYPGASEFIGLNYDDVSDTLHERFASYIKVIHGDEPVFGLMAGGHGYVYVRVDENNNILQVSQAGGIPWDAFSGHSADEFVDSNALAEVESALSLDDQHNVEPTGIEPTNSGSKHIDVDQYAAESMLDEQSPEDLLDDSHSI